jgi:hypothetical protein
MTSPQEHTMTRPGNDAYATIAGFVFQVNLTIHHWLQLSEGQYLELEAGEDIDLVRQAADEAEFEPERLFMQPKHHFSDGSVTLRSRDALESIANFCYHRRTYPDWKLRYRFITTLPVGKEQGWAADVSGIQTWEEIRQDRFSPEKTQIGVEAIRKFLRDCNRPKKFPVRSWNCLKSVLNGSDSSELLSVIRTFEWTTEHGNHRQARDAVISALKRLTVDGSRDAAERIFDRLFMAVFSRLSEPGQKVLNSDNLRTELARVSGDEENLKSVRRLMTRLDQLEGRVTTLEVTVEDHGAATLLRKYPDYSVNLEELFWRFGTADDTTLSVLGALLESEDECDQQIVIGLLYEGPVQVVFTHPQFVERILDICARRGEDLERRARQAFLANTTRVRGAFAAGGGPIQFHAGLSDRAKAQLVLCEGNSPASRLYFELAGLGPVVFPGLHEEFLDEETE